MRKESQPQNEMLKDTPDMMILRSLVGGDAHGHTLAKVMLGNNVPEGLKSLNSF
jgi:PadR family transcriptional regulator PadR